MSLNYELANIKNWETVTKVPDRAEMAPLTNALIWATMPVGIPDITEANAGAFHRRLSFYEKVRGSFLQKWDENNVRSERYITLEDIVSHIGLSTNASKLTEAQFIKRVWAGWD